ncbi:serine/threonine-protein kinase [Dactylosporangium sp. NPDC051484]|uniref:serine/threonine-protein kinase n=1 Tax=Dactylosporangium sp. NPDC051484 TaxID=3154942 RepID=UPI0034501487
MTSSTPAGGTPLVIKLDGPGWRAELHVAEPSGAARTAEFDVPLTQGKNAHRQHLVTEVRYTTATNWLRTGWEKWFVKVYHCRDNYDAELLRRYLGQQSAAIQTANAELPGPSRIQVDPPWAAVPVHIVRCDGLADNVGPVRTELAATPQEIADKVRLDLPAWLTSAGPHPERYLLAISPFMELLRWDAYHNWPATEHLRDFEGMAAGLDMLHRMGTVHCDIKPDNVCRYNTHRVSGYVLIDTDSVTQFEPPPKSVRATKPYHYRGLSDWFANAKVSHLGVDPAILRAHDRFGFAVVVLTALAGRDWVDRVLLRNPDLTYTDSDVDGPRTADSREHVKRALRQHWPNRDPRRQWDPLIDALAEPFGREIEAPDWWLTAWIARVIEAEQRCVVGPEQEQVFEVADPAKYRTQLDDIRSRAARRPARREDVARMGYEAVAQAGVSAARKTAIGNLLLWSLVAVPVFLLVFTLINALD